MNKAVLLALSLALAACRTPPFDALALVDAALPPPDTASPVDLAQPQDFSQPALPDLSAPDLALPDLAHPDLRTFDLTSADLAGCSVVGLFFNAVGNYFTNLASDFTWLTTDVPSGPGSGGTYVVSGDLLSFSVSESSCPGGANTAAYRFAFSADCATLNLTFLSDNCGTSTGRDIVFTRQ